MKLATFRQALERTRGATEFKDLAYALSRAAGLPPAFASRGASAQGLSRPIALALKTYLVFTSPEDKYPTQL